MIGLITSSQLELIHSAITELPDGGEYRILHVGVGIPHELNNVRLWSSKIHRIQRKEVPLEERPGEIDCVLSKRIHVIFSDIDYSAERIAEMKADSRYGSLRTEEGLGYSNVKTGVQDYMGLDILEMDLDSDSVDIIIAIGIFSKCVIWKDIPIAFGEISRVLNNQGRLFCTVRSEYLSEFSTFIEASELSIVRVSEDVGADVGVGRRALIELTSGI